jgi:hypothetical protein
VLKEVNDNMNSKLKFLSVALLTVAVAGVLLYTPLTRALQSAECNETSEADRGDISKLEWVLWFLNNSEPVAIEGAAVTLLDGMLVVNTADGQVRVALPEEWTVGTDVVAREMLFESSYLSVGENVTVSALRADIIQKEGLSIYFAVGYEIVDDAGVHAYAAIPINIET